MAPLTDIKIHMTTYPKFLLASYKLTPIPRLGDIVNTALCPS